MIYQIVITDRAAQDLEEAYLWIAARAPENAGRWYNGFLDALESLANNPERCSMAPESPKFPVEVCQLLYGRNRSYRAFFTIQQQRVTILHIRHTARREATPEDLSLNCYPTDQKDENL
jgi:plasmid stabilization system protein ParE